MKKMYVALGAVGLLAVGGASVFLLSGGSELFVDTGYETAERAFIAQFVNLEQPDNHVHVGLRYTNNLGMLSGLVGFDIPQLIEFGLNTTTVGADSVTDIGVRIEQEDFALQLAQMGSRLITTFPGMSDYFWETTMVDGVNDFNDLQESIMAAIALAPQLLDIYFDRVYAITEREEEVSITGGGLANIRMTGTQYSMVFTAEFIADLVGEWTALLPDGGWLQETLGEWYAHYLVDEPEQVLGSMHAFVVDNQIVSRQVELLLPYSHVTIDFQNIYNDNQRWFELGLVDNHIFQAQSFDFRVSGLFNRMGQGYNGPLAVNVTRSAHSDSPVLAILDTPLLELTFDLSDMRRSANGHLLGTASHSNNFQGIGFTLTAQLEELVGNQAIDIAGQAGMFGFNMDLGNLQLTWYTDYVSQLTLPTLSDSHRIYSEFGQPLAPVYNERANRLAADLQAVIPAAGSDLAEMLMGMWAAPGALSQGGLPWAQ